MTLRKTAMLALWLLSACSTFDWEITGVVVDEAGRPLPGVGCVASAEVPGSVSFVPRALPDPVITDSRGRFELRVDDGVDEAVLACFRDGYALHMATVRRGDDELRVVLARGGVVEGSVRLDAGFASDSLRVGFRDGLGGPGFVGNGTLPGETAPDGSFRTLPELPLPAGEYRLIVSSTDEVDDEGYGVPIVRVPGVVVRAGETTVVPEIDLRDLVTQVEVRAVDAGGEPISEFDVWVRTEDEDGEVSWSPIEEGRGGVVRFLRRSDALPLRDVLVLRDGSRAARLGDVSESVVATLEPAIRVQVRLDPPPVLEPGESLSVSARSEDGLPGAAAPFDAEGVAELRLPSSGEWSFSARYRAPRSAWSFRLGESNSRPVVTVTEDARQAITFAPPPGELARARDLRR